MDQSVAGPLPTQQNTNTENPVRNHTFRHGVEFEPSKLVPVEKRVQATRDNMGPAIGHTITPVKQIAIKVLPICAEQIKVASIFKRQAMKLLMYSSRCSKSRKEIPPSDLSAFGVTALGHNKQQADFTLYPIRTRWKTAVCFCRESKPT